jgi:hypothetical protein
MAAPDRTGNDQLPKVDVLCDERLVQHLRIRALARERDRNARDLGFGLARYRR